MIPPRGTASIVVCAINAARASGLAAASRGPVAITPALARTAWILVH
jgi:hypothetical protein